MAIFKKCQKCGKTFDFDIEDPVHYYEKNIDSILVRIYFSSVDDGDVEVCEKCKREILAELVCEDCPDEVRNYMLKHFVSEKELEDEKYNYDD